VCRENKRKTTEKGEGNVYFVCRAYFFQGGLSIGSFSGALDVFFPFSDLCSLVRAAFLVLNDVSNYKSVEAVINKMQLKVPRKNM
jgi:hypothetical protein